MQIEKSKLKSLEIQREDLETALASMQSSVEFTEKAFENGSEVEILNMSKQMSNRLQELNSAKWQLEPCVDDGLKFKSGSQLKDEIATFGAVTDVGTCASMSAVTMETRGCDVQYTVWAASKNHNSCQGTERKGTERRR